MDWQAMRGAGAKRFCSDCQKHVHDLSQLGEPEARVLLAEAASARLCVRYVYDAQGAIVFGAPLVPPTALVKAKRFAAAALAFALPMSLEACTVAAEATPPLTPQYQQTMGYPVYSTPQVDAAAVPADAGATPDADSPAR